MSDAVECHRLLGPGQRALSRPRRTQARLRDQRGFRMACPELRIIVGPDKNTI